MTSPATCSHVWIDPDAPPIARRPLSPLIGAGPYAMKPDTQYRCRNCGWTIRTAPAPDTRAAETDRIDLWRKTGEGPY